MATPPFDLNLAIHQWRRRFTQATPVRGDSIDEMEAHLRDSVAALQRQSLTQEEAFLVASRRMGPSDTITAELAKVHPGDVRRNRAGWMLAGVFVFILITDFASLVSGMTVLLGNLWSIDGLRLGWLGVVASGLALTAAALAIFSVVFGRKSSNTAVSDRWLAKPAFLTTALLGTVIALKLAGGAIPILLARQMSPTGLGGVYTVLGWGGLVAQVLFLAALALVFVRLASQLVAPTRSLAPLILVALLVSQGAEPRVEAQTTTPQAAETKSSQRATLDQAMKLWQAVGKGFKHSFLK